MYISNFKVLYINLKQDLQKKKKIVNDLEKLGLSYKRIDAVYGKLLKDIKYRTLISSKLGISSNKLHPNYWTNRSNFKTMTRYKDSILAKISTTVPEGKPTYYTKFNTDIQGEYNRVPF